MNKRFVLLYYGGDHNKTIDVNRKSIIGFQRTLQVDTNYYYYSLLILLLFFSIPDLV